MSTAYVIWTTLGFSVISLLGVVSLVLAADDSEDLKIRDGRASWSWIQLIAIGVLIVCMIGATVSVLDTACPVKAIPEAK